MVEVKSHVSLSNGGHIMQLPKFGAAILAICLAAGCSKASLPPEQGGVEAAPGSKTGTTAGATTPQQSDWSAIEKLEVQAKAIAKVEGCQSSPDCRSAPVGSRACGGPRYYIPWCAKTTDSAALYRKLAEVAKAEEDYNKKYQLMSTCEFRTPPTVESSGGSCVAK